MHATETKPIDTSSPSEIKEKWVGSFLWMTAPLEMFYSHFEDREEVSALELTKLAQYIREKERALKACLK